tara:strand:- start:359 stop:571 length:213 start_codon:yes stop_codon:yes gene_type:complete
MSRRIYVCSSETARNNGRIKKCNVRLELDEFGTFHCPSCAALLVPEDSGPSVSELLRKGFQEEINKIKPI